MICPLLILKAYRVVGNRDAAKSSHLGCGEIIINALTFYLLNYCGIGFDTERFSPEKLKRLPKTLPSGINDKL